MKEDKYKDVDKLLRNLLSDENGENLSVLFENKLEELEISATTAGDLLGIEWRTLNGILHGTQKRVDYLALVKIAQFLNIDRVKLIETYTRSIETNFKDELAETNKVKFILENFDLPVLKKIGFIDYINNYDHIETRIKNFFSLNSIYEYRKPNIQPAFSAGVKGYEENLTRSTWIKTTLDFFSQLNNPHIYDREALKEVFPKIRWHSTKVEEGLGEVIKILFKYGISIVYQAFMPKLSLRGATIAVNDKPCIVLTDYKGFYPTLWFALVHELYHVLFDWDEIKKNTYHISGDSTSLYELEIKEKEANDFAREYLLPKSKSKEVFKHIENKYFIEDFALKNHIHPSIIYCFYAFDNQKEVLKVWGWAKRRMPDLDSCISNIPVISITPNKSVVNQAENLKTKF